MKKSLSSILLFLYCGSSAYASESDQNLSFKEEFLSDQVRIRIYEDPELISQCEGWVKNYQTGIITSSGFPEDLNRVDKVDYFYQREAGFGSKRFVTTDQISDCIALLRSDGFIAHIHQTTDLAELNKYFSQVVESPAHVYLVTQYYSPQLQKLINFLKEYQHEISDIYVGRQIFTTFSMQEGHVLQCFYCKTGSITVEKLLIPPLVAVFDHEKKKAYAFSEDMIEESQSFILQGVQRLEELNELTDEDSNFSHPALCYDAPGLHERILIDK